MLQNDVIFAVKIVKGAPPLMRARRISLVRSVGSYVTLRVQKQSGDLSLVCGNTVGVLRRRTLADGPGLRIWDLRRKGFELS